jgi:branched-chain amino acid transport system permease protein
MTTTADPAASDQLIRGYKFNWVDTFLTAVRVIAIFVLLWGLIGALGLGLAGEGLGWAAVQDLIVAGVAQGSMYGLLALGYSMVYGILGFINFAHGEVFMSGAMVGFFVANAFFDSGLWESNFLLAILIVTIIAIGTSTLTAVIIERVAYRPLRNAPRLIPLITSIGISFFIQYAYFGLFGPSVKTYPPMPDWLSDDVSILGFDIQGTKLLVIVIGLVSMVGLWLFVERTRVGRAMRAVAEDKEIAALMGIDVDRTIVVTFAVGGAMAGIAAILWAMLFRGVWFLVGFLPGIKAFTAAVLGGVGNIVGAMLGGLTLGLFEALGPNIVLRGLAYRIPYGLGLAFAFAGLAVVAWAAVSRRHTITALGAVAVLLGITGIAGWSLTVSSLTQLKDVVAFSALVLVLIFKPSGLLGEQLSDADRT